MNVVKPKKFTIRLSECGRDTSIGNYKRMEDTSALVLAHTVCNTITDDFVGKDNALELRYHLACALLSNLEGWKEEDLLKDIKKAREFIKVWRLKDQGESN
jgi:hypothetical protein